MPANQLSFRVTEAYRDRIAELQGTIAASARLFWRRIPRDNPDLDAEYDRLLSALVPALTAAQAEAVRTSTGYLQAFQISETGKPVEVERPDGDYIGQARDGRALRAALASPLIGVKAALKEGKPLTRALDIGQTRLLRMLWLDLDHAKQSALQDAMIADDRVRGWQRGVRGTCGACLGDIAVEVTVNLPSIPMRRHPFCQCEYVPVVSGVRNLFPLATGAERLARMSEQEQNESFGPKAADALRSGEITLADLVGTSHQREAQDFLTQKPLSAA